jgi:hypothetical protein
MHRANISFCGLAGFRKLHIVNFRFQADLMLPLALFPRYYEKLGHMFQHATMHPISQISRSRFSPMKVHTRVWLRALRPAAQLLFFNFALLVLCVAVQAVYAKTAYYPPASSEARHFSMSVKIALIGQPVLNAPVLAAIVSAAPTVHAPEIVRVQHRAERKSSPLAQAASFPLLRSPPVIL